MIPFIIILLLLIVGIIIYLLLKSILIVIGFIVGSGLITLVLRYIPSLKIKWSIRGLTGLPTIFYLHSPFLLPLIYSDVHEFFTSHQYVLAFMKGYSYGVIVTAILDLFSE